MDLPQVEHRRVKISTNLQTSTIKSQHLANSHPFTGQLKVDVIFPSSDVLESALSKLEVGYYSGKVKLSEVVEQTGPFADIFLDPDRNFMMLGTDEHSDDGWCIDPRGLLTLSVSKETYERLGLIGKKLPFKTQAEQYVIRVPLRKNAESVAVQKRRREAFESWDARRQREGLGTWTALYYFKGPSLGGPDVALAQFHKSPCRVTQFSSIHIPQISLKPTPPPSKIPTEDQEIWGADMAALFEWIGMASLGSQRLKANDRVNPYVAVYECPEPSYVGNITHLRWTGFIPPDFLQSVLDIGIAAMKTLPAIDAFEKPFIAFTSHAISTSPVSYIPQSANSRETGSEGPMRLPRADGEDTWCLLVTRSSDDQHTLDWSIVESLGQYDTRWG